MAAATPVQTSCSSVSNDKCGEFSINDRSYCELLNSEIQVLHNEVKSLTEIINILNSELKTTRATEDTLFHSKATDTMKTPSLPCDNCDQLEIKLQKAQEEINSQKFIISLLNERSKPVNKPHQHQQTNLKIDNGFNTDRVPTSPPQLKKMYTPQDILNYEQNVQYVISTSNRCTALYSLKDHAPGNSLPASHKDASSFRHNQRSKTLKLKSKTCPAAPTKSKSSSITAHHNLQDQEPTQKTFTIPTIINGAVMKKNQSVCINTSNLKHKIVVNGDSHVKGFSTALQSVLTSECETFGVTKPGLSSNMLSESITVTIKQLSKEDVLVISGGSNDYELDNF